LTELADNWSNFQTNLTTMAHTGLIMMSHWQQSVSGLSKQCVCIGRQLCKHCLPCSHSKVDVLILYSHIAELQRE